MLASLALITLGAFANPIRIPYYGPRNVTLRYARPVLRFRLEPSDGMRMRGANLFVNDERVTPKVDAQAGDISYEPPTPLPPGRYEVAVGVTLTDGASFTKKWSFQVGVGALLDLPTETPGQAEFLKAIAPIRAAHRLEPIQGDRVLAEGSRSHAAYLMATKTTSHDQTQTSHPLYTGRTHGDRLATLGWVEGSWEGLADSDATMTQATRRIFTAPYHRIPFLQPGPIRGGGAQVGARCTILLSAGVVAPPTQSPADGQRDVPVDWDGLETPDPLAIHGEVGRKTGYPILFCAWESRGRLNVTEFVVKANGQPVPGFLNTPTNDANLTSAAIFLPRKSLAPKTTYQVSFRGEWQNADGTTKPLDETWSFTTG